MTFDCMAPVKVQRRENGEEREEKRKKRSSMRYISLQKGIRRAQNGRMEKDSGIMTGALRNYTACKPKVAATVREGEETLEARSRGRTGTGSPRKTGQER